MRARNRFPLLAVYAALWALLWPLAMPAVALPGTSSVQGAPGDPRQVHTVCLAGPPACDYASLQEAVDVAGAGDVIKVAAGTYHDLHARAPFPGYEGPGVITQVVYLSESLAIRGGYTTSNGFADPPDPVANPTTLDAQQLGRVLFVAGAVSPTIEGLRLTGGSAAGLGGGPYGYEDAGGGAYLFTATATLSNCRLFSNTASMGGGIYLQRSAAVIEGSIVSTNTASYRGGGLYLFSSEATLAGNEIRSNVAPDSGGGAYLDEDASAFVSNTIAFNRSSEGGGLSVIGSTGRFGGNTVTRNSAGDGGGVFVLGGAPILTANMVLANGYSGRGGGLFLWQSDAVLSANTISGNTGGDGGGLFTQYDAALLSGNDISGNSAFEGGGLYLWNSANALSANAITANDATGGWGGGLSLRYSNPRLDANTIRANMAWQGSALYLFRSTLTADNDVVADNSTSTTGSGGVYVQASSLLMRHTTLARNSGSDGTGLYVTDDGSTYSSVALTNTIIVSQSVGVTATAGSQATLDSVLWFANGSNTGGGGIITVTQAITGNPLFAPDGYHILSGSAALDRAVPVDLPLDIDGDYRPAAAPPDLGADELVTTTPQCRARLNGGGPIYTTLQAAIAASTLPSDVVEAAGLCEDAVGGLGRTSVAVLTRTLTLRGGYSLDFGAWDPALYPTVLSGRREHGVLAIGPGISPTVEYLDLLEGLSQQGGGLWSSGAAPLLRHLRIAHNLAGSGGGVYLNGSSGAVEDSRVEANWAHRGGGLHLSASAAQLTGNTITANNGAEEGGGLYLTASPATLAGNELSGNSAGRWGGGLYLYETSATVRENDILANDAFWGGGVYLYGNATFTGNTVLSNTAFIGGGLCVYRSSALVRGNTIAANAAADRGGGAYFYGSATTLEGNVVTANSATHGGGLALDTWSADSLVGNLVLSNTASGDGGGLHLYGTEAVLTANTIRGNTASGNGGGLYAYAAATLRGNTFSANTATNGGGAYLDLVGTLLVGNRFLGNTAREGGGLYMDRFSAPVNSNVVASNHADHGSGLYLAASSFRLLHSTVAGNDGDMGSGIYVTDRGGVPSNVTLFDTILVSHSVGITVTVGSTATLEASLWGSGPWANGIDWGGSGAITTGTINLWAVPSFLAPAAGDYHLGPGSAARDTGIEAGATVDMDGQPRPIGAGYDIGADEFAALFQVSKQAAPDPVRAGGLLTYTLRVTNSSAVTLSATVIDALPPQVTPSGILTWTAQIPFPSGVWTQEVIATVTAGYTGVLTNVVQATIEGVTISDTCTTTVEEAIAGLAAQNDSPTVLGSPTALTATVAAGSDVTYTWAFGDGDTGAGTAVAHTYLAVGTYTAVVTASNPVSTDSTETMVMIIAPAWRVYLPLVVRGWP